MQAAAIILTIIALYAMFYSLCRIAAETEAKADRYRRRVAQARASIPAIWRVSRFPEPEMEVVRGQ